MIELQKIKISFKLKFDTHFGNLIIYPKINLV